MASTSLYGDQAIGHSHALAHELTQGQVIVTAKVIDAYTRAD